MHAVVAAALALSGLAAAAPTLEARQNIVGDFGLRANNSNINQWAIVNAHIAAGQNSLQIQRPTVYQPDPAYLNSTTKEDQVEGKSRLAFALKGVTYPFEAILPNVQKGEIGQVFTEPFAGTAAFSTTADSKLNTLEGGTCSFYACTVQENGDEVFALFYGVDFDPASAPTPACQAIDVFAK